MVSGGCSVCEFVGDYIKGDTSVKRISGHMERSNVDYEINLGTDGPSVFFVFDFVKRQKEPVDLIGCVSTCRFRKVDYFYTLKVFF